MSTDIPGADLWAGYISGAVSIILGNSMDVKKVQLQAGYPQSAAAAPSRPGQSPASASSLSKYLPPRSSLLAGSLAPVLGNGALTAILMGSYTRTEDALNRLFLSGSLPGSLNGTMSGLDSISGLRGSNLWTTYIAGAVGGLAIWVVSVPTELIKCRVQLASSSASNPSSSVRIAQEILRTECLRGLYRGGVITALRDSIGYGFYFWAYALGGRLMDSAIQQPGSAPSGASRGNWVMSPEFVQEASKVLLCGGIAGIVTWASVYPLDTIKTRVQSQSCPAATLDSAATPLLGSGRPRWKGAVQISRETYRQGGVRPFFSGLGWCSVRAFFVNAVQWGVYEWILFELGHVNHDRRKELHTY